MSNKLFSRIKSFLFVLSSKNIPIVELKTIYRTKLKKKKPKEYINRIITFLIADN